MRAPPSQARQYRTVAAIRASASSASFGAASPSAGERTIRPVARLQEVARPNAAALDPQRQIRVQTDRLLRAPRIGYMAVAVDRAPLRRHSAVVEDWLADEL